MQVKIHEQFGGFGSACFGPYNVCWRIPSEYSYHVSPLAASAIRSYGVPACHTLGVLVNLLALARCMALLDTMVSHVPCLLHMSYT